MAKLPRVFQKIFGVNAVSTQFGVFGSMAQGSVETSKNLTDIQSLAPFSDGWYAAVLGQNAPAIQDRNSLDFLSFSQLAYLFQAGIAEWETNTIYFIGSFAVKSGILYYSITDTNTGNDPAVSTSNWIPYDTTRPGVLVPFAGLTAPFGYLLCDGSAISRTTYAALFNAIAIYVTGTTSNGSSLISAMSSTAGLVAGMPFSGPNIPAGSVILSVDSSVQIHISQNATANGSGVGLIAAPWGVGDGLTTFNVPDLRGRVIAGRDDMGGSAANRLVNVIAGNRLGNAGGTDTVTLSTAQIPSHTHPVSATTGTESAAHAHGGVAVAYSPNGNHGDDPQGPWLAQPGTSSTENAAHTHSFSTTSGGTGSGGSHSNLQPTAVANFMIKT